MTINSKKIWIVGLAAVVILAGAFFLLPKSAHNSKAIAGPVNPVTAEQTTAPDQWKIVPADVLSTDVRWSPLTGDGSN
jgi:hypothetical protein